MNIKTWVQLIGEDKIVELRNAAAPLNKKPLWIATYCDDEQMAEIYYRIFERGEDLKEIAKMARNMWGIRKDWQLQDFVRGMERWKQRLMTPMSSFILGKKNPEERRKAKKFKKKQHRVFKKLDALGTLGYAIKVQVERLAITHAREKAAKMPLEIVEGIQKNLTEMINSYVTLGVKTGLMDGVPAEYNVNLKAQSDAVLTHVVGDYGPRMIRGAQKFLEAMSQRAEVIDMDLETGKILSITGGEDGESTTS
jgi:hypothetical protein